MEAALHSVPIGIPMASVSHPPPPVYPPQHGPAPSYFHMPPTATMSPPPAGANFNNNTASSIIGSAGFLSPSQSDVIFSGIVPSNGRGRTATRSRSASSGLSDRSRSSSKVSGTSSPLGSVSPSGYGSPSGSRANSVLGNKRSSTDVGVAGRSVAVGVGAAGRNGIASSARQSSTSPPSIGSPLANGVSFPTSNLGTIVANVPLQTDNSSTPSSSVITNKGGPPLSRSGISWSRSSGGSSSQARLGRTGSGSSISSSGSSGSVGTANASTSRSGPSAAQVAAAAPSAGAASLPLPVRKPSVGLVLPNGEPRPTVIISPKTPTGPAAVQGDSTASSGVSSPSGGMSMDTREAKLDEAMMKVRAASAAQSTESSVTTPPPSAASTLVNPGDSPYSDADEVDTGTFVEHNLANRTPSNSPMKFTKPLSSSVVPSSPPPPDPSLSPSTPSKSPPALKVVAPSPKSKSLPSSAIVTPSSAAPTLTSQATTIAGTTAGGDGTMVGKATDSIVSSAKGLLGAIWGGSNDGQGASK